MSKLKKAKGSKKSAFRNGEYEEMDAGYPERSRRTKREKKTAAATDKASTRLRSVSVEPRTDNQADYLDILTSKTIAIGVGPAGTGKSYLAGYAAASAMAAGEVDGIVITRAMVTVGKEIGHLPGTEVEKMMPYVAPIIEVLSEMFGRVEVDKMMKANIIRLVPLALMRGYTFKNTFIIFDEAQNTSPHEFKTILTRIGEGSRMAVMGDIEQCDIQRTGFVSGLENFVDLLDAYEERTDSEVPSIGYVEFDNDDVQRSEIVKQVLNIYLEEDQ